MMHTSEKFPESWWSQENAGECLTVLLMTLQTALESRSLEHYFVSSVNLLKDTPELLCQTATSAVELILEDSASAVSDMQPNFAAFEPYIAIAND